jgi:hypothetical protein
MTRGRHLKRKETNPLVIKRLAKPHPMTKNILDKGKVFTLFSFWAQQSFSNLEK